MLTKLFAYFFVLMGTLWIIWPELLRGWFTRKANFKFFWLVLVFLFFSVIHLLSLIGQVKIPILRSFGTAAVLIFIVIVWTLRGKAKARLTDWCRTRPLIYFRVVGLMNIAMGASLLFKHA